jgi:hypothetical protein
MYREHHELVNGQLYGEEEAAIRRLNHPMMIEVESTHRPVHGAEGVPGRTLGLPAELFDRLSVNPPELSEVLLAKAERAEQLLELAGSDPTAV